VSSAQRAASAGVAYSPPGAEPLQGAAFEAAGHRESAFVRKQVWQMHRPGQREPPQQQVAAAPVSPSCGVAGAAGWGAGA